MRLNLGCGPDHLAPAPWVNVDSRAETGAEMVADVTDLPVDDGAVERVYAGHLLEHIPLPDVAAFLAEVRRVLQPGGVMMVVGPDIDRCVRQGEPPFILESVIAHGQPPSGHSWTCHEALVLWLLESNGWEARPVDIASVRLPDWPNDVWAPWQLAVEARLPARNGSRRRSRFS